MLLVGRGIRRDTQCITKTQRVLERCKNPFSTLLFLYVVVALEEQYVKTYVHAYVYVCLCKCVDLRNAVSHSS